MGDATGVGYYWELPVHSVYVSTFYMAKYETSWGQWKQVRDWARQSGLGYTDLYDGSGKADDHQVHWIRWYDMVKWCNARSEKENLVPCYRVNGAIYRSGYDNSVTCNFAANGYRLPTEAEWKKAARGKLTGQNFPWGTDTITHSQANYYSSTYYAYAYDVSLTRGHHPSYTAGGYPYTAPVDSFTPNAYGLFNMAGNVWEWCWDWYGSYPSASQTNPTGATSGSFRVVRGGGWGSYAYYCRAASRDNRSPSNYYNDIGFRVARSSVP